MTILLQLSLVCNAKNEAKRSQCPASTSDSTASFDFPMIFFGPQQKLFYLDNVENLSNVTPLITG